MLLHGILWLRIDSVKNSLKTLLSEKKWPKSGPFHNKYYGILCCRIMDNYPIPLWKRTTVWNFILGPGHLWAVVSLKGPGRGIPACRAPYRPCLHCGASPSAQPFQWVCSYIIIVSIILSCLVYYLILSCLYNDIIVYLINIIKAFNFVVGDHIPHSFKENVLKAS